MTGCTVSRYKLFETSPEMIEQELRPAVCEHRQTVIVHICIKIPVSVLFAFSYNAHLFLERDIKIQNLEHFFKGFKLRIDTT